MQTFKRAGLKLIYVFPVFIDLIYFGPGVQIVIETGGRKSYVICGVWFSVFGMAGLWMFRLEHGEANMIHYQPAANSIDCGTLFLENCLDRGDLFSIPPSRSCILNFISMVKNMQATGKDVVVCAALQGKSTTSAAVLLGSYLIISEGLEVNEVMEKLLPISSNFVAYDDGIGLMDCLSAIQHSKKLGWFDSRFIPSYEIAASSRVHLVVPGRLLFCPDPETAGSTEQATDAALRADALSDLGVCLLLRIGAPRHSAAAASALRARGFSAPHLPLDGGAHFLQVPRICCVHNKDLCNVLNCTAFCCGV